MRLQDELDGEIRSLQRISVAARRRSCAAFADILWSPAPEPLKLMEDPGVMFESPRRVFVFQRIMDELRYYAGGWCPEQSCIYLEQDRIEAEGCELGVIGSTHDALVFAERYLVEELGFDAVNVPREVRYARHPNTEGGESTPLPGPPLD